MDPAPACPLPIPPHKRGTVPVAPPTARAATHRRFSRSIHLPNAIHRPAMAGKEVNYIHEQTIFADQIEKETAAAAEWFDNWGFLANKPQPPPKGFSTRTAKYAFGGNSWSLQQKRVSDESKEGISAAEAERNIRKTMANLTWQSRPHTATKPCEAKGAYKGMVLVESDTSGVKHREAVRFSLPNDRLSCVTNQANLFRVCLACPPCTHAPCAIGVVDANAQIPISRRRMPHGRSRPGREISKASDSQPGGGMASKNVSGQWAPRS